MVVDTSALLCVLWGEHHANWVASRLDENADDLVMSTVNLAECLILLQDKHPESLEPMRERLSSMGILFVPPDFEQAAVAAQARLRYPLNLGDCFAYALTAVQRRPILTLDTDFRKTDLKVIAPRGK